MRAVIQRVSSASVTIGGVVKSSIGAGHLVLHGVGTGKPLRDCPDCVADTSEFLEHFLSE